MTKKKSKLQSWLTRRSKLVVVVINLLSLWFILANSLSFTEGRKAPDIGPRIRSNITYGPTPLEKVDVYLPKTCPNEGCPVVLYIHGGAWAFGDKSPVKGLKELFNSHGLALVSTNYRLAPDDKFPIFVQDIAKAVEYLNRTGRNYELNMNKAVLMGHSAGAHIVGCIFASPSYLQKYSLAPSLFKGGIILDSAALDISMSMRAAKAVRKRIINSAFGEDAKTWKAASPTLELRKNYGKNKSARSVPPLQVWYVERKDAKEQSTNFVATVNEFGGEATLEFAPGDSHKDILRELGEKSDPETKTLLKFILDVTK